MKKFIRECWLMFRVIINPIRWVRSDLYSKSTDRITRDLIEKNAPIERIREHVTKIGPLKVWTSNYPYAYGSLFDCIGSSESLPSRRTVILLKEYIEDRTYQQLKEKI